MKSQIAQGAEAVIVRKDNKIEKKRISKGYRIPEIDEKLRKLRTRSESRILEKASKLIDVPKVLKVDEKEKLLEIEFIDGKKLSENLDKLKNQEQVCKLIGENTAKLHDAGIIHGDLTTSNMILVEGINNKVPNLSSKSEAKTNKTNFRDTKKLSVINNSEITRSERARGVHEESISNEPKASETNPKLFFIDFGLSFHSQRIEDKAVDLHLLKQALEAKHFQNWQSLFESVLNGYKQSKNYSQTLKQLEKVEARGRYKH